MQLSKIIITGLEPVHFPIFGALPSDKFIVKSVDGLGPSEVDVLISNTGYFQGRRPQNREIVLKIGLAPDYAADQTSSDLRDILYGLLTPAYGRALQIQLLDENGVTQRIVEGHARSVDPVIFAKDPEVQVVIRCTSPYLQAPSTLGLSSTDPIHPAFNNPGTAPSGFFLKATFQAPINGFNLWSGDFKRMHLARSFVAGDVITIDTRPKSRRVLLNDVTIVNTLDALSPWHMLHRGVNTFDSNVALTFNEAYYFPMYWGV